MTKRTKLLNIPEIPLSYPTSEFTKDNSREAYLLIKLSHKRCSLLWPLSLKALTNGHSTSIAKVQIVVVGGSSFAPFSTGNPTQPHSNWISMKNCSLILLLVVVDRIFKSPVFRFLSRRLRRRRTSLRRDSASLANGI